MSVLIVSAEANDRFEGWNNSDKWDAAGDAALNPDNIRRLVGIRRLSGFRSMS